MPPAHQCGLKPIIHYVVEESSERAGQVSAQSCPGYRVIGVRDVVEKRLLVGDAGVAREYVDATEPPHHRGYDPVDVLAARDVALLEDKLSSPGVDLADA